MHWRKNNYYNIIWFFKCIWSGFSNNNINIWFFKYINLIWVLHVVFQLSIFFFLHASPCQISQIYGFSKIYYLLCKYCYQYQICYQFQTLVFWNATNFLVAYFLCILHLSTHSIIIYIVYHIHSTIHQCRYNSVHPLKYIPKIQKKNIIMSIY